MEQFIYNDAEVLQSDRKDLQEKGYTFQQLQDPRDVYNIKAEEEVRAVNERISTQLILTMRDIVPPDVNTAQRMLEVETQGYQIEQQLVTGMGEMEATLNERKRMLNAGIGAAIAIGSTVYGVKVGAAAAKLGAENSTKIGLKATADTFMYMGGLSAVSNSIFGDSTLTRAANDIEHAYRLGRSVWDKYITPLENTVAQKEKEIEKDNRKMLEQKTKDEKRRAENERKSKDRQMEQEEKTKRQQGLSAERKERQEKNIKYAKETEAAKERNRIKKLEAEIFELDEEIKIMLEYDNKDDPKVRRKIQKKYSKMEALKKRL
ncbi:MAG: hypothetical protein LBC06_01165 [Rickettsiales bacterium]|nr:hypothetical protein [Rickettsiales bacterium]